MLLAGVAAPRDATARECGTDSTALQHDFASGAAWYLCAVLDADHGLEVRALSYQAPGDQPRPMLDVLHLAGVLIAPIATPAEALPGAEDEHALIDPSRRQRIGGEAALVLDAADCDGERAPDATGRLVFCHRSDYSGVLARYRAHQALPGNTWQLYSVASTAAGTLTVGLRLREDGLIEPVAGLSGRSPLDAARDVALLYSWRIVPAIDQRDSVDSVHELRSVLDEAAGNRRPLLSLDVGVESYRAAVPEQFRRWLVQDDASGRGLLLDPQTAGLRYSSPAHDWSTFALAVTRFRECERHVLGNTWQGGSQAAPVACASGLDGFVDGESLSGQPVALWYHLTEVRRARRENDPVISAAPVHFALLPFDWTAQSPFEVIEVAE